jgi:hypothetical protein
MRIVAAHGDRCIASTLESKTESLVDFTNYIARNFTQDGDRDIAIWGGGIVIAIVRSRESGVDVLWITEDIKT